MSDGGQRASSLGALAALIDRLGACASLEEVLVASLDALADDFLFTQSMLLLLDETGSKLFTIASRGYARSGVGSEVRVGEGVIGQVAAQRRPLLVNNLQRMLLYARSALRSSSESDDLERHIPLPGLADASSQLAVPAIARGRLVGVLAVESERLGAFTPEDEQLLSVVGHLVASAVLLDAVELGAPSAAATPALDGSQPPEAATADGADAGTTVVRFYGADGSTFLDGDYLIKGVAGRILWRLLSDHVRDGRIDFTTREIRLDPSLELPAFRDNLESRLILLKRRLDDRGAPVRIERTGRGRFRLDVRGHLRLDAGEAAPAPGPDGLPSAD